MSGAAKDPMTAGDLVAEARAEVENLSVEQVAKEIAEPGTVLVDLREPAELEQTGRIPGAVHVPRGMLEFRADPSGPYHQPPLDPSSRVILHCASGGRSALGAQVLQRMGYENVAHLDGGFTAWKDSGQPVE